jgi:acyl dehydratase
MTTKRWAFEDFVEGATISFGSKTVTADEIIEFAGEFDAQPMHLEEEAGKTSLLGGLGASGWHTCCMFMRMLCDGFLLDSTSQGSPGIDYAKWKKPVIAGDTLTGRCTVIGTRTSKSRPGLGFVTIRSALLNQRDEEVFELQNTGMFLARGATQ